jgi:tetratricopeptide (TPR) repeat protein
MTHIRVWLAALLVTLLVSLLPGCATPPTKEGKAKDAFDSGINTSQLWLTIDVLEFAITARAKLVISVDGAPDISYPAQQDWSDGRASERFQLPMGRSRYTFRFKATLFDGARTFEARASEPFVLERANLPVTRQTIRLYPTDSQTWGRHAVARLFFSVGDGEQPQETSLRSPMTVEEVVGRLEAARDSHELSLGETVLAWDNHDADVARAKSALVERLKTRPGDTQILLLWARARFQADSLPTPEAALDRVLAVEPHNAEALYHKGRYYGAPVQAGKQSKKRSDLNLAVPLLRQAVEYAPNNLKYRKTLALFLADQGHAAEAKSTLSAAPKSDPMVKLVEELASVPLPEGAEYFFDHPLRGAYLIALLASETIEDYLNLRVRLYRISKSPAEIGAFYATRIPEFRFVPVNENPPGAQSAEIESEVRYLQFLRIGSGAVTPSRNLREIPDPRKREPGILMMLFEMRNDPELGRAIGPGEHNCYLLLVNSRK